jgi:thiol-disulfide isomerase/thioredoxin
MTDQRALVYNHDTFQRGMAGEQRFQDAPRPGDRAPDFDLPATEHGARFRLSARREKRPVLVTFGALTCPYTLAAVPAVRELHAAFADRIDLVTVYVREMHPGERRAQARNLHEKMRLAREWKALDGVTWTVAVDRIDGEVHRAYGLLPAPAFLVDSRGRIAFRSVWAGERRALHRAMERVLDAEGLGAGDTVVGAREASPLAFVHGTIALRRALARGGVRARDAYRAANSAVALSVERLVTGFEDLFTPPHRAA